MRKLVLATTLAFLFAAAAAAQVMDGTEFNVDGSGLVIEGYDPVAYFTLGEATPGSPQITAEHNGVRFQFSSEEHRQLFVDNPEQYLPQYGAYCAWAASEGYLATVDPEAFVIRDDRLFLNYSNRINRRFSRDLAQNIERADENWTALSQEASTR